MKRIFMMLLLAVCCTQLFAQSATQIFTDYRTVKGVKSTEIPEWMMKMARNKKMKDSISHKVLDGIDSMWVLEMSDCSRSKKNRFGERVQDLLNFGYDEILRTDDDGDNVSIMAKAKNGVFTDILLFIKKDDGGCQAVLIRGHVRTEDVKEVVKMAGHDD